MIPVLVFRGVFLLLGLFTLGISLVFMFFHELFIRAAGWKFMSKIIIDDVKKMAYNQYQKKAKNLVYNLEDRNN